jgi:hypothetical protein
VILKTGFKMSKMPGKLAAIGSYRGASVMVKNSGSGIKLWA